LKKEEKLQEMSKKRCCAPVDDQVGLRWTTKKKKMTGRLEKESSTAPEKGTKRGEQARCRSAHMASQTSYSQW